MGVEEANSLSNRQGVSILLYPKEPPMPAEKKKPKCKHCEGKGLIKQGDKKVKCQRCGGTGYASPPAQH